MKLTKFEHAAMVLDKSGDTLVIDPGGYTTPLTDVTGVVAIVITHEHADHWTAEQLNRILEKNPDARIIGPAGVAAAATDFTVETVKHGDKVTAGSFELEFFGEKHAVIHESIPLVDNVGVMVDNDFYYGGDSYTQPGVPVNVLAVPIGAPWLRIGEVMDYVLAVKPAHTFPVHEAPLSKIGKDMAHARVEWATQQGGGDFRFLDVGESYDL